MNLALSGNDLILGALLIGLLGLVECFFGYHFFRILLAVIGFLIGAWIGATLVNSNQAVVVGLVALLGGILGALFFYFFYFIGTFLAGIALGTSLALGLAANFGLNSDATFLAVVVGAVIGGILGMALSKYIIMLSTAFTGATQFVYAVLLLLPGIHFVQSAGEIELGNGPTLIVLLIILGLGMVGFFVQLNANRQPELVAKAAD